MLRRDFLVASLLVVAGPVWADPAKWEVEIQKFEAADRKSPPKGGGVLFVGSSSIRMWDLGKSFPGRGFVNRGFGGSQLGDVVHYFDRIVLPHKPRLVVVYGGENDVAAGGSAEQVFENYQKLAALVHEKLPQSRMIYIGLKSSPSRWKFAAEFRKASELIRRHAAADPAAEFVDAFFLMLDEAGQPRKELFVADQLHLNDKGYALWAAVIGPKLD